MESRMSVNIDDVQEFLFNKITRARKLYRVLFLEDKRIDSRDDAIKYLALGDEYNFLIEMFREIQIFNWLTGDKELESINDVTLK